jgi:hypothetical protein
VQNEGDIGVSTRGPYQIAYGSLVPRKSQYENLLVPVCVSSSHIAFGSIRMEPVFMILGQSAATAAMMALDQDMAVQDLPYEKLSQRLLADGQVLELKVAPYVFKKPVNLKGIVIDDTQAKIAGDWHTSTSTSPFVGRGYQHDGDKDKGRSTIRFEAKLMPGRYEVRIAYSTHSNRATNVPVNVRHADGETTVLLNQRRKPKDGVTQGVGTFEFKETGVVIISNKATDGHVIADAVQFLPAKK